MAARLNLPVEAKQAIIDSALASIMAGDTIEQIAHKHHIAPRTLDYWLADLGEEYTELRKAWIDNMLTEGKQAIDNASRQAEGITERDQVPSAQLRLACARETWNYATWYAERRDTRYKKDSVAASVSISLNLDAGLIGTASDLLVEKEVEGVAILIGEEDTPVS